MTAEELIRQVEEVGGTLTLRGNRILYRLPKDETSILAELKAQRDEVVTVLRSQCPPLPRGIRLVRYEPKAPPVTIDVCSVVVDVEKFIQAELRELDARLHSPVQIRGGWGVFTILDRLRQAGLDLEIDATLKKTQTEASPMPYKVQLPPNLKDKKSRNLDRTLPPEKAGTVGNSGNDTRILIPCACRLR